MSGKYDDIIDLPHPEPQTHPRMPMRDRAAQFAPFAALTGYDAAIRENARLTQERIAPAEAELAALDRRFRLLQEHLVSSWCAVSLWSRSGFRPAQCSRRFSPVTSSP